MKIFDPLIIHSCVASSKTAIVCCPLASVPAFGSVNPKAPIHSPLAIFGRYFCFCASVPNFKIGQLPKEVCAETTTPVVPQAFDNSSTAIAYIKLSPPAPPYCVGIGIPIIPISAIFLTVSTGNLSSSSNSVAKGFTSFSTNSLIICLKSSCVLGILNSMSFLLNYFNYINTYSIYIINVFYKSSMQ